MYDKNPPGWLVWSDTVEVYSLPDRKKSTFLPWEASSAAAVDVVREITTSSRFWEDVSAYYSEENHETSITLDNVSCVKSICSSPVYSMMDISINDIAVQLLEDEPFEAFRPTVEKLIADKDQNKQRAAAEFLAGVLGGLFVYL